jgi:hypothetical protein
LGECDFEYRAAQTITDPTKADYHCPDHDPNPCTGIKRPRRPPARSARPRGPTLPHRIYRQNQHETVKPHVTSKSEHHWSANAVCHRDPQLFENRHKPNPHRLDGPMVPWSAGLLCPTYKTLYTAVVDDAKPVEFLGSSLEDLRGFPLAARREANPQQHCTSWTRYNMAGSRTTGSP